MIRSFCWLGLLCGASAVAGAETWNVLPEKIDGVAPREVVHAWWLDRVRAACDRADAEYEKLKTPDDCAAYQQRMKAFFFAQLGELPPRTPLNAKVVEKLDRGDYRIEKILFESQPGHYVSALLYLPAGKPPFPGVLFPCGHSNNGKAGETYQRGSILLAKNGLAVLCYDPIDQGERFQLLDPQGKPLVGNTMAHCLAGVGAILLGRNTATYRVWDGMRTLDYLVSRPEIDPQRIGCTGNSGGGTLTSYLMALDDRILSATPSCYLTSFRRLMETIGPQDAEQNIHGQIAFGLGHAEYVLIRAPKPTLMCTATKDFFDIGGAWETFRKAKRVYARLGHAERVDLMENDDKHGFNMPLRVAAARWQRRWLLGIDDAITEPDFPIEKDPQIQCTPQGQVMLLPGARNVYDLNREFEERLAAGRRGLWQAGAAQALAEVRRITGIRPARELPELTCDKVGTVSAVGLRIDKLVLRAKDGPPLAALALAPEKRSGPACLYLNAAGKAAELDGDGKPSGRLAELLGRGWLVLAVDLSSLGETEPGGKTSYAQYLGSEWQDSSLAYMLGTSYLTQRAEEILACREAAARYESAGRPAEVHLVSLGLTCPPALHAAALEPERFASLTMADAMLSWAAVVRKPLAAGEYVNVVHGALRAYDLSDLLTAIPPQVKVTVLSQRSPTEPPPKPAKPAAKPVAKPAARATPKTPTAEKR